MHRYHCIDFGKQKRASNTSRGRCRTCLNENMSGDGNRPNRPQIGKIRKPKTRR